MMYILFYLVNKLLLLLLLSEYCVCIINWKVQSSIGSVKREKQALPTIIEFSVLFLQCIACNVSNDVLLNQVQGLMGLRLSTPILVVG